MQSTMGDRAAGIRPCRASPLPALQSWSLRFFSSLRACHRAGRCQRGAPFARVMKGGDELFLDVCRGVEPARAERREICKQARRAHDRRAAATLGKVEHTGPSRPEGHSSAVLDLAQARSFEYAAQPPREVAFRDVEVETGSCRRERNSQFKPRPAACRPGGGLVQRGCELVAKERHHVPGRAMGNSRRSRGLADRCRPRSEHRVGINEFAVGVRSSGGSALRRPSLLVECLEHVGDLRNRPPQTAGQRGRAQRSIRTREDRIRPDQSQTPTRRRSSACCGWALARQPPG